MRRSWCATCSEGFKSAAGTLEYATVVADVFHLVRLGLTALNEVRRRGQQELHGHRGHKNDPLFRLRRVLRVSQERLAPEAQETLTWDLIRPGSLQPATSPIAEQRPPP